MLKKVLLVLIPLMVVLQFFSPTKNEVQNRSQELETIMLYLNMTDTLFDKLTLACLDCHSNTTIYPWYAKLSPLNFWLNGHIKGGQKHLNFSEWSNYDENRKEHSLSDVAEVINDNRMPLKSYKLVHRTSILTDGEKAALIEWATNGLN